MDAITHLSKAVIIVAGASVLNTIAIIILVVRGL